DSPVTGTLRGAIGPVTFDQTVTLAAREHRIVTFTPDRVKALFIDNPRVWWPYRMGPQNLYTMTLTAETPQGPSDREQVTFGIQQMTSELTPEGHRLFKVNGKPILIRGGGWASYRLLRPPSRERLPVSLRSRRVT